MYNSGNRAILLGIEMIDGSVLDVVTAFLYEAMKEVVHCIVRDKVLCPQQI